MVFSGKIFLLPGKILVIRDCDRKYAAVSA